MSMLHQAAIEGVLEGFEAAGTIPAGYSGSVYALEGEYMVGYIIRGRGMTTDLRLNTKSLRTAEFVGIVRDLIDDMEERYGTLWQNTRPIQAGREDE